MSNRPGDTYQEISARTVHMSGSERNTKRRKVDHGAEELIWRGRDGETSEAQYQRTTHEPSPVHDNSAVHGLPSIYEQGPSSKHKSFNIDRNEFFNVREFRNVADRLKPGQNKQKRKPGEPSDEYSQNVYSHMTLPFADFESQSKMREASRPIDLTGDGSPPAPASRPASTATFESSPYKPLEQDNQRRLEQAQGAFNSAPRSTRALRLDNQRQRSISSSITDEIAVVPTFERSPSKRPQSPNGDIRRNFKRTSPVDDSESDELRGRPTIGMHSKTMPENMISSQNNHQQLSKTVNINDSFSSGNDVPSPDIVRSQFSNTGRKRALATSGPTVTALRRKKEFAWPIKEIWTSEHGPILSPNLSLVYNTNSNDFDLIVDRKRAEKDHMWTSIIRQDKVRAGFYEYEGRILNLNGARDNNVNYNVDVTFQSYEDMIDFKERLELITKRAVQLREKPS